MISMLLAVAIVSKTCSETLTHEPLKTSEISYAADDGATVAVVGTPTGEERITDPCALRGMRHRIVEDKYVGVVLGENVIIREDGAYVVRQEAAETNKSGRISFVLPEGQRFYGEPKYTVVREPKSGVIVDPHPRIEWDIDGGTATATITLQSAAAGGGVKDVTCEAAGWLDSENIYNDTLSTDWWILDKVGTYNLANLRSELYHKYDGNRGEDWSEYPAKTQVKMLHYNTLYGDDYSTGLNISSNLAVNAYGFDAMEVLNTDTATYEGTLTCSGYVYNNTTHVSTINYTQTITDYDPTLLTVMYTLSLDPREVRWGEYPQQLVTHDAANATITLAPLPGANKPQCFYRLRYGALLSDVIKVVFHSEVIAENGVTLRNGNTDVTLRTDGIHNGAAVAAYPSASGTLALTSQIPTTLPFSSITATPTTISGYGIADAYTKAETDDRDRYTLPEIITGSSISLTPVSNRRYLVTMTADNGTLVVNTPTTTDRKSNRFSVLVSTKGVGAGTTVSIFPTIQTFMSPNVADVKAPLGNGLYQYDFIEIENHTMPSQPFYIVTKTELFDAATDQSTARVTESNVVDWDNKADTSAIPTHLASLQSDTTHRTVSDTEKTTWNVANDMATRALAKSPLNYPNITTVSNLVSYIDDVYGPHVVWEVENPRTQGIGYISGKSRQISTWPITGLDLSPYKYILAYIQGCKGDVQDQEGASLVVRVDLDSRMAAPRCGLYVGTQLGYAINDNGVKAGAVINVSGDKTSVAMTYSNFNTTGTTALERDYKLFKIEGYKR